MDKLKTALNITGQFEGSGYGNVTGSFDGMGISAGVLQWNYGKGTLQELLRLYKSTQGPIPDDLFPEPISQTASMTPEQAVRFSSRMQDKTKLLSPWKNAWKAFLYSPPMIAAQMEASKPYAKSAEKMMASWGMDSTRAFCWFFDVAVQNGGLKGVKPSRGLPADYTTALKLATPKNREIWNKTTRTVEMTVLLRAAYDRALLCRAAFRQDVFDRKGTIAMGVGVVHKTMWTVF